MDPTVLFEDAVLIVTHWHNLQIVDIGGLMLSHHVRQLRTAAPTLAARFPKGTAGLTFVRAGTPFAAKETRDELTDMMKAHKELRIQSVVVLEEPGIIAGAVRSMLRAMLVVSGNGQLAVGATFEKSVDVVLPLVRTRTGSTVTRAQLDWALKQVRAAYDERSSDNGAMSAST
jgi:hypothetical protein